MGMILFVANVPNSNQVPVLGAAYTIFRTRRQQIRDDIYACSLYVYYIKSATTISTKTVKLTVKRERCAITRQPGYSESSAKPMLHIVHRRQLSEPKLRMSLKNVE
jgi:hypothetical protein